jgi:uncharacterized short protein YbdD (DUF466 family)
MNRQSNRLSCGINVLARRLRVAAGVTRVVLGVPDYERYLAHAQAAHPNEPPLTSEEFARERMTQRYSKLGSRCC